ncbi:MAG: hypothetical protein ACKOEX_09535 [Planctomycetia bacterium]
MAWKTLRATAGDPPKSGRVLASNSMYFINAYGTGPAIVREQKVFPSGIVEKRNDDGNRFHDIAPSRRPYPIFCPEP